MTTEPLRIGLAGLGTVGAAVVRLLDQKRALLTRQCGRPIEVVAATARDRTRDRGIDLSGVQWLDDPVAVAQADNVDVFVELIGGDGEPALSAVKAAFSAGKHVVTANKALIAAHGVELAAMAEEQGVLLNFEAAVAGGIPVIKTMREAMAGNTISRLYGILNGTCNYILTRMEDEEIGFEEVLAEAQSLGYAEADPTFDIEGNDTAHKLAIMTSIAFGTRIAADDIYLEGISNITLADIRAARDLGYRIKLLGVAQKTDRGIEQRVHPTMVPIESQIAQVDDVTNAVVLETDLLGALLMSGPGAGGEATASAVIGDVADIAKSRPGRQHGPALGTPAKELAPYEKARMRSHEGGYFIRFLVRDEVGVFAAIAQRMASAGISLQSIVQRDDPDSPDHASKAIILTTHATMETSIREAIAAIESDGHLRGAAQVIRMEPAG
ncbi:homoserine dehydrogenase [Notoacmeibacter marinus]|uniref:Homoserine dehydrogenase n=1 Tax=Notoacmeibacter marinus TaxID=1876515 RepID=A0A231UYA3_9HYPH|nr:homoserine dehydrogenase [Notoacmeibacter marinus]OXT00854.1 homoserine dehydrogenase [Notoacmeibacter marinus]